MGYIRLTDEDVIQGAIYLVALIASVCLVAFCTVYLVETFRRRRARKIMDRGGPKTRKEWLFLFPGCCPKCLSRDIDNVTGTIDGLFEDGRVLGIIKQVRGRRCVRCHTWSRFQSPDGAAPEIALAEDGIWVEVERERVQCPYLPDSESRSIDDFKEPN